MNSRALLLCALAVPGLAAAADDAWYVAPFLGGTIPDYRRDADHDSLAYGLDVGHELGPVFNIELSADGVDPRVKGLSGHLNLDSLSLDMLAVANREGVVSPYVGLGLGAVRSAYTFSTTYGLGYDTTLAAEAEAGVMVKLWQSPDQTSKLSLRPELKMRWANPGAAYSTTANEKDYLFMVGIQYSFGGSPPPPAPVAVAYTPPPPPPAPCRCHRHRHRRHHSRRWTAIMMACPIASTSARIRRWACSWTLWAVRFRSRAASRWRA